MEYKLDGVAQPAHEEVLKAKRILEQYFPKVVIR